MFSFLPCSATGNATPFAIAPSTAAFAATAGSTSATDANVATPSADQKRNACP
jgi:hypothetical protein